MDSSPDNSASRQVLATAADHINGIMQLYNLNDLFESTGGSREPFSDHIRQHIGKAVSIADGLKLQTSEIRKLFRILVIPLVYEGALSKIITEARFLERVVQWYNFHRKRERAPVRPKCLNKHQDALCSRVGRVWIDEVTFNPPELVTLERALLCVSIWLEFPTSYLNEGVENEIRRTTEAYLRIHISVYGPTLDSKRLEQILTSVKHDVTEQVNQGVQSFLVYNEQQLEKICLKSIANFIFEKCLQHLCEGKGRRLAKDAIRQVILLAVSRNSEITEENLDWLMKTFMDIGAEALGSSEQSASDKALQHAKDNISESGRELAGKINLDLSAMSLPSQPVIARLIAQIAILDLYEERMGWLAT